MEMSAEEVAKNEKIIRNLFTKNVRENQIKIILNKTNSNGRKISLKALELEDFALLLNYFNYDVKKLNEYTNKYRGTNTPYGVTNYSVKDNIKKILDIVGVNNITELPEKKKEYLKEMSDITDEVEKIDDKVEKLKSVLSFFSIKTSVFKEKMKTISEKGKIEDDEYLKELYTLRELFLQKAKGDIVTQQTEILYEIEEDEEGNILKKRVYKNKNNKQMVTVRTQSYLPDEKSLVAIKLIDEMILQIENSKQIEITEQELVAVYEKIKQETLKQKELLLLNS
jgi:hypothetical protein